MHSIWWDKKPGLEPDDAVGQGLGPYIDYDSLVVAVVVVVTGAVVIGVTTVLLVVVV